MIDAKQAERDGLVCRVVPTDQLLSAALEMGEKIASFSQPAVAMAKETVNAAYELNLEEGLRFERRIFHSMFALVSVDISHSGSTDKSIGGPKGRNECLCKQAQAFVEAQVRRRQCCGLQTVILSYC